MGGYGWLWVAKSLERWEATLEGWEAKLEGWMAKKGWPSLIMGGYWRLSLF